MFLKQKKIKKIVVTKKNIFNVVRKKIYPKP